MDKELRKQERKMLTPWKQLKSEPIDPVEQAKIYRDWLQENRPEITAIHVFQRKEYLAGNFTPIVVDLADYK